MANKKEFELKAHDFVKSVNPNHFKIDGRSGKKSIFKQELEGYKNDPINLISTFSKFGLFMLEHGTRRKSDPDILTMFQYIKVIEPIAYLLNGTDLLSLNDFELCSLFEQIQEMKGDNKATNSALLNLFSFLDETYGKSLTRINIIITSDEGVDVNLLWPLEVEAILQSNELSELDKLFILTLYESGCRITEVYQLIGEDICTVGELLHFRTNRLGKMKNRYSTRYLPFHTCSNELISGLLSNQTPPKTAIFDYSIEQNKQQDFQKFCMRVNSVIKKITGRNVNLKHLRHSRARIRAQNDFCDISIRPFYQNAGYAGHSNLLTGQKNYTHSFFEENSLIEMSDENTCELLKITPLRLRKWRSRFRKKNQKSQMSNDVLNSLLSRGYMLKKYI